MWYPFVNSEYGRNGEGMEVTYCLKMTSGWQLRFISKSGKAPLF